MKKIKEEKLYRDLWEVRTSFLCKGRKVFFRRKI